MTNIAKILSIKSMGVWTSLDKTTKNPDKWVCPEVTTQTGLDLAFWGMIFGGGRIPHPPPIIPNPT
jgi:hypothetical protein